MWYTNGTPLEIKLKSTKNHWNSWWNPVEILVKYQKWNSVEIRLKYQKKSDGNKFEIGVPFKHQLKWITNQVEISMKFKMKL